MKQPIIYKDDEKFHEDDLITEEMCPECGGNVIAYPAEQYQMYYECTKCGACWEE